VTLLVLHGSVSGVIRETAFFSIFRFELPEVIVSVVVSHDSVEGCDFMEEVAGFRQMALVVVVLGTVHQEEREKPRKGQTAHCGNHKVEPVLSIFLEDENADQ
jgi:hypothetical protein